MRVEADKAAKEPWHRRLLVPNYKIVEVAKYARVSPQTVARWHEREGLRSTVVSKKEVGGSLSYLQLIEVAVVAAIRSSGVSLKKIGEARGYIQEALSSEYPFADYRFKTDGKRLLIDYAQVEGARGRGKLLEVNRNGQLAWEAILKSRLQEFEYDEKQGLVMKWHVAGSESPVLIDPRLSFGAPTVKGTPTWAIKGRWEAGEEVADIADDFRLDESMVLAALSFEDINVKAPRSWAH